ncbi:hypothetical protein H2200_005191 [Cladophialophora chaetospira]|uniref:Uncharacterized protein n=1 Tax=Cladophialophora chaetospira TaxID=386627 RepID=A0AA38XC58_9EURO|nr:hypothetical protein H2200_005191 [Cladophialophora chaetospira]
MAPTKKSTQTQTRSPPKPFDLDHFRRKIIAERYWNKPWFERKHGLFVGELPPRTPEPERWRAWENRHKEAYRRKLEAEAFRIANNLAYLDEQGDSAMPDITKPARTPKSSVARKTDSKQSSRIPPSATVKKADSNQSSRIPPSATVKEADSSQLSRVPQTSTVEKTDGWTKFVKGGEGTYEQPVEIVKGADSADVEMKDVPEQRPSLPEQQPSLVKKEQKQKRIKVEREPTSPAKVNAGSEKCANSFILNGAPSDVPRPVAPSVPVQSASEKPRPQVSKSSSTGEIFLHAAENYKYPLNTKWRIYGMDQFDMALSDLENPNSTLNSAKRDRPWRVIRLGKDSMENQVKSGPTRPGGRGRWERHCRVEKRPARRTI